jgi:hypothetical protein
MAPRAQKNKRQDSSLNIRMSGGVCETRESLDLRV